MTHVLAVGDQFSTEVCFTQEDVIAFARISGDANPLHLDSDFAATTLFKRPIMHGMLSASVFSRVLGMDFPGPGTVYLSQNLAFKAPMFVDTVYRAHFVIRSIQKFRATIETWVEDERGQVTLSGEAVVLNRARLKGTESVAV
ncbi:MAG: MaoC family dehydratase [Candidatus Sericytochromatia bacterium]|nr:MaoC family dehydratase [Candidatus Sericytochromatia bacterium]